MKIKNRDWLLSCGIVALIFIIFGIIAIESIYESPFPIKSKAQEQDHYIKVIEFYCNLPDKKYPVVGEELNCCAHIEDTSKNQFKEHIPKNMYVGEHKFGEDYFEGYRPLAFKITRETISENKEKICSDIRINQEGKNTLTLGLRYNETKSNKEKTIFFDKINFFAYNIVEYDNKINQRLSLYFILFSLGIFSVFSLMKNILDIIKDRK